MVTKKLEEYPHVALSRPETMGKLEALTALEKLGREAMEKNSEEIRKAAEEVTKTWATGVDPSGRVIMGVDLAGPGCKDETALATYVYNEQGKPVLLKVVSGPEAIKRFELECKAQELGLEIPQPVTLEEAETWLNKENDE